MGNAMVAYAEEAKDAPGGKDQQGQAELQANNAVSPGVFAGVQRSSQLHWAMGKGRVECTAPVNAAALKAGAANPEHGANVIQHALCNANL